MKSRGMMKYLWFSAKLCERLARLSQFFRHYVMMKITVLLFEIWISMKYERKNAHPQWITTPTWKSFTCMHKVATRVTGAFMSLWKVCLQSLRKWETSFFPFPFYVYCEEKWPFKSAHAIRNWLCCAYVSYFKESFVCFFFASELRIESMNQASLK